MSREHRVRGSGAIPDPRSGLDSDGHWAPAFEGQRPPFEPGNDLGALGGRPAEHGAYAELALSPRAEALAARLRALAAGHLTPADDAGIAVAALSAIQLATATGTLEEVNAAIERGEDVDVWLGRLESRSRLSQDARRWSDTVRRWFDQLGLTPAGRTALEQQSLTINAHVHISEVRQFLGMFLVRVSNLVEPARKHELIAIVRDLEGELRAELSPAEAEAKNAGW